MRRGTPAASLCRQGLQTAAAARPTEDIVIQCGSILIQCSDTMESSGIGGAGAVVALAASSGASKEGVRREARRGGSSLARRAASTLVNEAFNGTAVTRVELLGERPAAASCGEVRVCGCHAAAQTTSKWGPGGSLRAPRSSSPPQPMRLI